MTQTRESDHQEPRVIYTCWPTGRAGNVLCGLLLVVIGGALLADMVVPGWSQAIWGVALLALGVWVLATSRTQSRPW